MYEKISEIIITTIKIGNELYDKVEPLHVEDKLTKLVKELVKSIKQKLNSSDDTFFKYAYENADILLEIVQYHPIDEGGSFRNGMIYIGEKGLASPDVVPDGDTKATIFHEYMHYIAFKLNKHPTRYEDEKNGIIYSEIISVGDELESDEDFLDNSLNLFIQNRYSTESEFSKYDNYPMSYKKLSESQKQEVQDYIKANNLVPETKEHYYQYKPSNLHKDEINAHNKTKEAYKLGLYTMSQTKLADYDKEIIRYKDHYKKCVQIELEKGYTSSGHRK